jgi:uncharacterized protein (TIGR03083 family)
VENPNGLPWLVCPGSAIASRRLRKQLAGRPEPVHTPRNTQHVRNDMGHRNEVQVDWRRSRSGTEVLDEFRQYTTERLAVLRGMSAADFEAETQTPIGPGTVRTFIEIRIFDAWIHEQDMRRALRRPGHLEGDVAAHAVGRCAMAMPLVVGRRVQPPDGTTVVFEVTGAAGRTLPIAMQGGRANVLDACPLTPTVRLIMDVETFTCLSCGRGDPGDIVNSARLRIDGDRALGEAIVRQMNIMV